jgi:hypothetical protein
MNTYLCGCYVETVWDPAIVEVKTIVMRRVLKDVLFWILAKIRKFESHFGYAIEDTLRIVTSTRTQYSNNVPFPSYIHKMNQTRIEK